MHVALLRWEQLCKAGSRMLLFPEQFQHHASLSSRSESLQAAEALPIPNPLPGIRCSPSSSLRPRPRWEGGLTAPEPPTPIPRTSLDPGATLRRVRGSRGLALPCPPLALAAPNTCQPPSEGGAQPQPRRGLFLRSRWQLRCLEIGTGVSQDASAQKHKMVGGGLVGQLPARVLARPVLLRVPVGLPGRLSSSVLLGGAPGAPGGRAPELLGVPGCRRQ